jgi:hypothetical protein
MTAHEALTKATDVGTDARLQVFSAGSGHRRMPARTARARRRAMSSCPECLTVFDDYGTPINAASDHVFRQLVSGFRFTRCE